MRLIKKMKRKGKDNSYEKVISEEQLHWTMGISKEYPRQYNVIHIGLYGYELQIKNKIEVDRLIKSLGHYRDKLES